MRLILTALLLVVFAAPAASQVPVGTRGAGVAAVASATVWGQIRSEKSRSPLRYAVVELVSASAQPLAAVSDSAGVYVLRDVPPGRRLLRVTHFDHAPNEVEILVSSRGQHVVDFDLEFRPFRLTAVTAEGGRSLPQALDTVPGREADFGPAAVRVLESTPGVSELGLVDAARDVPNPEPIDPSDVLYVRGGSADLKLVLLNGAPVYAPFHIGGLINALDTNILRYANLYMGGAPARYDGGLSYIMDLESRSGKRQALSGTIAADLLSSRMLLEGPVGPGTSVIASARSVHGLGTEAVLGTSFPYSYGDANGRLDVALGGPHVISLTGFWNHEKVALDTAGAVRESASWGNRSGSMRYRGRLATSDVLGTVSVGRFQTLLPLGGILPRVTEGTSTRVRASFDVERPWLGGRVFWGASAERIDFGYRAFDQGVSRDNPIVQTNADGDRYGAYGEAAFSLVPRVRVRAGLRADLFSRESQVELAPRLSASVLLTDHAALTLSAGQYHQYVRAPERSLVFLGSVVPDSGGAPALSVAEATHVVLALTQDFAEGIRLGIDGFFKEFTGLQAGRGSKTQASGVDLWLRRNAGVLNGWLGYSLSWIWALDDEGSISTQSFSGRHLVNAGVIGPLIGGSFDVRVSYGAGLPYTAIPEPEISSAPSFQLISMPPGDLPDGSSGVPTEPQAPYIRVDAQVSRGFPGTVGEHTFVITPYIKVINALNRRDAIFYQYNRDAGRAEPLADLPIVPIVGLEWKF